MILDTSAVIDLLKGNLAIIDALKDVPAHSVSTTCITIFELYQGVKQKDKERVEELLRNIHIIDLDAKSAKTAGEIQARLKSEGQIIDPEDTMIAGIAIENGLPVVTANKKHFGRIKELQMINY